MKCALARDHLVENGAESKNIGAMINGFAAHLLGSHISRRSHDNPGESGRTGDSQPFGISRGLSQLGEAEVENLGSSIFGDEEILRLQIAVDDSFFVGRRQAGSNLHGVIARLPRGDRSALQYFAQALAFEEFRNQIGISVLRSNVVQTQNVGMIQCRDGARFLLEATKAFRIARE